MNQSRLFRILNIAGLITLAVVQLTVLADATRADTASSSIAIWSFDDGIDGCQALRDVELSVENGALHVEGTGNDPHFIGPAAGGQAGWKKVLIRAKSNRRSHAQIFWTTEATPNTSEANSVRFHFPKSDQWIEKAVYFQVDSPLRQLRLDPHDRPVKMIIDSIEIYESGPPPADLATDPAGFKTLPGFQVDLLYSVPMESHGSWVSMCVDPQGRLIVSDQYGSLHRVTLHAADLPGIADVETLDINIGSAHGLLYAFDSLYVMVNRGEESGLYRVSRRRSIRYGHATAKTER